jgi:predicted nucleic acid-binding protein
VRFTIDTSVFVDALRQPEELSKLITFLAWAQPVTLISSVVAAELLAGSRNAKSLNVVDTEILGLFIRRRRVIAPSAASWQRAGRLIAESKSPALGGAGQNDLLIALSAREFGWTVVTRDKDFARLRGLIPGLRVAAPFPSRSAPA